MRGGEMKKVIEMIAANGLYVLFMFFLTIGTAARSARVDFRR
jgi:hypothetical protein